jgi:uncharacterized repeat protein (TIGR03803 family)
MCWRRDRIPRPNRISGTLKLRIKIMPASNHRSLCFFSVIGALMIVLAAPAFAAPRTYTVINTFSATNGANPVSGLVFDKAGNLYGTTLAGGKGKGVVFELSPNSNGGWTESVIYEFGSVTNDGANPYGWLVIDTNGNLYGTTEHGGVKGLGTVFQLSPSGSSWTETILHQFGSIAQDGQSPIAGLAIDSNGNLFGTTFSGGLGGCNYLNSLKSCGIVFELSPTAGSWTYSVIHQFSNANKDGNSPVAGITIGSNGYLYGEAAYGSKYGQGTLFELIPQGNGTYTEEILHPWGFVHDGRPDGGYPYTTMVFDNQGYMYGTSQVGGTHGDLGTVFKFTYESNGGWLESNLHGFGNAPQGSYPESSLLVDPSYNLYGITQQGGTDGFGTIYELLPTPEGYLYKQLYNFTGKTDGALPTAALVMDAAGNLYGTTPYGGNTTACPAGANKGCGVVYMLAAQ